MKRYEDVLASVPDDEESGEINPADYAVIRCLLRVRENKGHDLRPTYDKTIKHI